MFKKLNISQKSLISNFFSLSSVEVVNCVFPLITLPYLVRVIGPEKFGLVAFAQAFVQYFVMFTDYGFNLSATRNISLCREDKDRVTNIFSSVIVIKMVLMIIGFIIMASIVLAIPKFRTDWLLYFFAFGDVLGNVFFPVWFFQGMERMKFIAFLNLLSKAIFLITIFIFVRTEADYIYIPLITSLSCITAGIFSLGAIFNRFSIRFRLPLFKEVKQELKDGWHIFISTAAISLYTVSNTFILGLFTNNLIVGYYSAAEKLIKSGQRLLNPISQTIYPHINKLVSESKEKALSFIKKVLIIIGGSSFVISTGVFLLSGPIVYLIFGAQYEESVLVLRILAFLPFIVALSNIFGLQTMVTFNMKEVFSKIIISAGFVNIILALILAPSLKHIGVAVALLITETYVTVTMLIFLLRKDLFKLGVKYEKV